MIDLWNPDAMAHLDMRPMLKRKLLQADEPRPLVIVLPGGGYGMLAGHEALPVADRCNDAGFHAAVLYYRTAPDHQHPAMIHDAQRAVRIVRRYADAWSCDGRVAILGFSAGGHLASCAATLYDQFTCPEDDLADDYSARPDAAVLCYPVIDMLDPEVMHTGSRHNLLRDQVESNPQLVETMNTHQQVTPDTPPCFLWHTSDDAAVHLDNSLRFTSACRRQGVPVELHAYESGPHGIGLATDHPQAQGWFDLAAAFLHRHLK